MKISQNKRNHPIAVTDIAIDKVPCIKLRGFSSDQNRLIQRMHKELLERVKILCDACGSDSMEVARLIDLHTWDYWEIEGKEERIVRLKDNPKAKQAMDTSPKNSLLLMHNHPSTGTFLGEDLKTFCNTDSLYIMAVVGNDGSIYVLIKDVGFDAAEAMRAYGYFAEKYKKYKNNGTRAVRALLKDAKLFGLYYKKGARKKNEREK